MNTSLTNSQAMIEARFDRLLDIRDNQLAALAAYRVGLHKIASAHKSIAVETTMITGDLRLINAVNKSLKQVA